MPSGEDGRTDSSAAVRGAVLVGVAVVLAIVLLNVVDDGSTGPIGDTDADATTTTLDDGTTPTTTSGGDVPATNPPAQVRVRVYNGGAPQGAAGAKTDELRTAGYQTLVATDTEARDNTVVYCAGDFAGDAEPLAVAVGGGAVVDNALDPLPAGAEETDCLVVLGPSADAAATEDTTEDTTADTATG